VEDFTLGNKTLVKADLDSMLKQNPELLLAQNQVEIAMQTQKEIGAARLPLVRLSAAYVYNVSQSQAGFSLYNQTMGPQAGLTLSVPLFTGGVNQRNYENAKLNVQSSEWRQQQTRLTLEGIYLQSWQNYAAALEQLQSDSLAINTAKSYIDLMQQRFSAGQNTIIELKEAQRSYEETYYRFISNQYIARLAETQLMSLTGQLVNN
jgi:outer membrane protein TolC